MNPLEEEKYGDRLVSVFKKLLQSNNLDDSYVDKILTTLDDELKALHTENISAVYEWLSEIIHSWNETEINLSEAEFLCRLIRLLSKYDETFDSLCTKNILNDIVDALKNYVLRHSTLKIIFIKMLSAIADHNSGCAWISSSQVWKVVVSIYFSNANLYVEREGILFFNKLLVMKATTCDENISDVILDYIFLPMQETLTNIGKDKKFNSNILLFLKLLEVVLKNNIFSYKSHIHLKLEKLCNIEELLNNLIENSEQEAIKEAALVSLVLFAVLKFENKENLLCAEDLSCVLDVFNMLLIQNQFVHIIKLSKYCQTLWNEMRHQKNCQNTNGGNFILIQLLPSLMSINLPSDVTQYELYMKKLFSGKSKESQKFLNSLGKAIKSNYSSKDLAVKGILSVITNFDCFNIEEGILILQAMIFITMSVIFESGHDLETSTKKLKKLGSSGIQDKPLLSAILNGVSGILKKFKINWTDLETFGLFKITNTLLKISNLSSLVVVQTLEVVKAAVLNCISPDVVSSNIQTNFESLLPLLYERMTDTSWEIRDSCLEVVIATAELSESKYPDLQEILLGRDFRSLLFDMVENDSESYVRASAIRALTVMTKIERLNPFLNDQDFCLKITKLVETESEGIVRREAALLIKGIYLSLNNQCNDLIKIFYKVMGTAAVCDLHWEVKINSLSFWETVIQRIISEETKLHKDSLNKDDMTQGLDRSLKKLSKIGCLHVLLTILKDDCDMIVIKKSAEVLSDLLGILKQCNVIQPDMSSCNATCRKRKNNDLTECESKIPSISSSSDLFQESVASNDKPLIISEKVIEDIVNDTDFNLLRSVSSQNEETDNCEKSVFFHEIEPELFLKQMEGFDKDKFLENKQKWFSNVETDLTLTLDKINIEHSVNEINIMDCY